MERPSRSRSRFRSTSRSNSQQRRPSLPRRRSSSAGRLPVYLTPAEEDLVPTIKANLDNSLPLEFFRQDIISVTKALRIHKWHRLTDETKIAKMKIVRISGALTNSIYKLELEGYPSLLLRLYGKNVDSIIDRESELKVLMKLSKKNIGPKLLGIFTNGRIEQFLEGFLALNKLQIRDSKISKMIARRMKELHHNIELDISERLNLPMCWQLINKWLTLVPGVIESHIKEGGLKEEDFFIVDFKQFIEIIGKYQKWLFSKYTADQLQTNLKFCHNDTQYGNLLLFKKFSVQDIDNKGESANTSNTPDYLQHDKHLVVIDFEYSGPNFPAYDLANHFSEWMADYHSEESYFLDETQFPSKKQQLDLIKAYTEYDFQIPANFFSNNNLTISSFDELTKLVETQIKKLYNECVYWRPAVQMLWCLWGVVQNGPYKKILKDDILEPGVDGSIYKIVNDPSSDDEDVSDKLNNLTMTGESDDQDDSFNYKLYSQQKAGLMLGDLIKLGVCGLDEIDEDYQKFIKYLDTDLFEI